MRPSLLAALIIARDLYALDLLFQPKIVHHGSQPGNSLIPKLYGQIRPKYIFSSADDHNGLQRETNVSYVLDLNGIVTDLTA